MHASMVSRNDQILEVFPAGFIRSTKTDRVLVLIKQPNVKHVLKQLVSDILGASYGVKLWNDKRASLHFCLNLRCSKTYAI